jgi:hypothetical protein
VSAGLRHPEYDPQFCFVHVLELLQANHLAINEQAKESGLGQRCGDCGRSLTAAASKRPVTIEFGDEFGDGYRGPSGRLRLQLPDPIGNALFCSKSCGVASVPPESSSGIGRIQGHAHGNGLRVTLVPAVF